VYPWFVFLHLVGLVLFLLAHGVSLWVSFAVRRSADPATARLLLMLSARGNQVMYVGLLVLAIGGLAAAATNGLLLAPWVIGSYVTLVVVFVGMYAVGAAFYYPLRDALLPKAGEPIEAAELARRVDNRRPELLALIGIGGLVVLVWLMVLKPGA